MATPTSAFKAPETYTRPELKAIFANRVMTDSKEAFAFAVGAHYGPSFMQGLMEEIWADAAGLSLAEYRAREAAYRAAVETERVPATAAHFTRRQTQARPRSLRSLATRFALAVANLI